MSLRLAARRVAVVLACAALAVGLAANPSVAHVDLETSTPGDGETVDVRPGVIRLQFSVDSVPAGDGIVLTMGDGVSVDTTVVQPAPNVIEVTPASELVDAVYSLAWTMKAGDAHPRTGAVSFRVAVDGSDEASANEDPPQGLSGAVAHAQDTSSPPSAGSILGWLGRWLAMLGGLSAIGALAFSATSLIGSSGDAARIAFWLRRFGVLVTAGVVLEFVGASIVGAGSVSSGLVPSGMLSTVEGSFGVALLLRLAGGIALLNTPVAVRASGQQPAVSAQGDGFQHGSSIDVVSAERTTRFVVDVARMPFAFAGVAAIAVSYLFDGHTVVVDPTIVVRLSSLVHVLAGGVWLGGVAMLASTLNQRYRRGQPLDAVEMIVRFSGVAGAALVAVSLAGVVMTWLVVDSVGDLFTSSWGRTLLVKLVLVGVAAAIGAYNHFRLVPQLGVSPDDASELLRRSVAIEARILILVLVASAILVGAGI